MESAYKTTIFGSLKMAVKLSTLIKKLQKRPKNHRSVKVGFRLTESV